MHYFNYEYRHITTVIRRLLYSAQIDDREDCIDKQARCMHCTSVQINTRQGRLCKKCSSPHGKCVPWLHFIASELHVRFAWPCVTSWTSIGQHGGKASKLWSCQAPPGLPIIVKRYSTCPPQVIARLVVYTGNVATHWASCSALATKHGHG